MKNIYKSIFRVSTRIKEGIKPKISQIQANSQQNSKDPRNHAKLEIPKYIFEIDQIQEKIRRAKMVLYKDLAKKFEGKPLPKKHIVTPKIPQINKPQLTQTQIQADQPYKFNKKKYTDVPKINQLMNAAVSIQFYSQSIKYENQESVQTLIQNVFSQETEKNLRKKEKSMRKTLLDGCKLQKDLIQNLLMLYGLRREQQFLQNLVDPLQKILSSNKNNERRMLKFLADMINRMNTRKDYYEQIIIYLPFQELIKFSKIVSLIKKIDIVSWIIKYQNLMDISKFVLQNKELQKAFDNIHTMTESKLAENQVSLKHTFGIQLWILKILQNFKQSFQAEQFTKQSIIAVCQNLTIYYNIKKKLQNIVKQRNLNTLFSQHNQQIFSNVNKQELLKSQQLLQQKQQEQFYQKVSQIILFSDIYKENKNQQLEIYSSVFPILLEFQDIKIADHTFQKVIDDHMKVFKKLHSFETVTQNYIQLFAQFILRNLEVSISNEYALAIIKILWLHNIEKYRNKQQMTFDQGKYFVMSIHIISSYIKNIGKVDKDVIEYEVLTKNLRKYASMIQKNREQFNRLNKKNVLNLLEKGMGQLSKTGRQKNTVANLLQQIKTIAYNDKS